LARSLYWDTSLSTFDPEYPQENHASRLLRKLSGKNLTFSVGKDEAEPTRQRFLAIPKHAESLLPFCSYAFEFDGQKPLYVVLNSGEKPPRQTMTLFQCPVAVPVDYRARVLSEREDASALRPLLLALAERHGSAGTNDFYAGPFSSLDEDIVVFWKQRELFFLIPGAALYSGTNIQANIASTRIIEGKEALTSWKDKGEDYEREVVFWYRKWVVNCMVDGQWISLISKPQARPSVGIPR
jgi:hypothetical protein